jgi:uncharacterized oligopeptide transporter (OPT) family protein
VTIAIIANLAAVATAVGLLGVVMGIPARRLVQSRSAGPTPAAAAEERAAA